MSDKPIFTIEVDVYDVTDKMLMSRSIAKGMLGDEETEVLITAPSLSPVVRFRGKDFMVVTPEIANAICLHVKYGQPDEVE